MYKNILVPLAPDHGAGFEASLGIARALLEPGGKITALSVIEAIPSYVAPYLPEDHGETAREAIHADMMADLAGAEDVTLEVVSGHPARAILDTAADQEIDCIVIASHRPGVMDYFIGSTAAHVVRHARCSVHVLR